MIEFHLLTLGSLEELLEAESGLLGKDRPAFEGILLRAEFCLMEVVYRNYVSLATPQGKKHLLNLLLARINDPEKKAAVLARLAKQMETEQKPEVAEGLLEQVDPEKKVEIIFSRLENLDLATQAKFIARLTREPVEVVLQRLQRQTNGE